MSAGSPGLITREDLTSLDMQHSVASEEDEEDVCRICRMPAEVDNTLFFPCKCSGSIKYVHQQCLVEWLNHSGNTHCEVCKHKFSFTPVYAKDAPTVLPWYQLLFGLLKRGVKAIRVAHRIWLVCSIWLVIVPLCTGLAWRIAFAHSAAQAAQIVLKRFSVLALITDCIQGSLLSIMIVFLNMGFSSLKDYLRHCIRGLEQQLLRSLPVTPEVTPAAAIVPTDGGGHEYTDADAAPQHDAADHDANPGLDAYQQEPPVVDLAGIADINEDGPDRIHDENQAEIPFEELIGLQGPWLNFVETIALVTIGNAFFMFMAIWVPLTVGRFGISIWKQSLQTILDKHLMDGPLASTTALLLGNNTAASASTQLLADAAASLVGNAGQLLANVSKVAANAAAPAAAVLSAAGQLAGNLTEAVASNITQVAEALVVAASSIAEPQCRLVQGFTNGSAALLEAAAAAVHSGQVGETLLAATAPVPASAPSGRGVVLGTGAQDALQTYPIQPLLLMVMTLEQMFKELQAHLEPPPRADFVALGLGHLFLLLLAFVCLWGYVSVRLWNLHARRTYIFTQQSVWQVLNTATVWAMNTLAQVVKLLKLGILLVVELGIFPLATGVWLDLCLLPLTNSTMEQRIASFWTAPLLLAFVHWLLGVAFMLAFTFLVCMTREVLRPGALPFLKDPTNPERNPIREMMEEPLLTHLARVSMSCILYAALCVTLVHFPALLARTAVPRLFPLRLYFLDPFTQIPADMLLFHVCVPFTVEHVKMKALVKTAIRYWLQLVGSVLGLQEYLLVPADAREAADAQAHEERYAREAEAPINQERNAGEAADGPLNEEHNTARGSAAPGNAAGSATQGNGEGNAGAAATQENGEDSGREVVDEYPRGAAEQVHVAAAASTSAAAGLGATFVSATGSAAAGVEPSTSTAPPAAADLDGTQAGVAQVGAANEAGAANNRSSQAQEQTAGERAPGLPSLTSFEEQPDYPAKLLAMGLFWAASMVLVGAAFFVIPVGIGRFIFSQLHLLLKNDLYSGALGMYALWGLVTMCRSAAAMANFGNMSAALRAGWRWLVLIIKCTCLAVLWLGVVATMLGILVELVLLPLHHTPAPSPLAFWYQDWTMGVLGLKLWHLVIMLTPRREGAPPPAERSWQAHFEALQRDGLVNLNFTRALRYIILPVMLRLAVAMAVPYAVSCWLLPYTPFLPSKLLEYANLYAYTVAFVLYVAYKAVRQLHSWLNELHNAIRDDWYLVGRELNNFLDAGSAPARNRIAAGPVAGGPAIADADAPVASDKIPGSADAAVTVPLESDKSASQIMLPALGQQSGTQVVAAASSTEHLTNSS